MTHDDEGWWCGWQKHMETKHSHSSFLWDRLDPCHHARLPSSGANHQGGPPNKLCWFNGNVDIVGICRDFIWCFFNVWHDKILDLFHAMFHLKFQISIYVFHLKIFHPSSPCHGCLRHILAVAGADVARCGESEWWLAGYVQKNRHVWRTGHTQLGQRVKDEGGWEEIFGSGRWTHAMI